MDKVHKGPLTLFDFQRDHDIDDVRRFTKDKAYKPSSKGWKLASDNVIGGFSDAQISLLHSFHNVSKSEEVGGDVVDVVDTDNQLKSDSDVSKSKLSVPFVRWYGTISTKLPKNHNKNASHRNYVDRSGYCYIRLPEFIPNGIPLRNKYNALELTCRTDGRLYTVNLKASTLIPDDLYQGFLKIPSSFTNSNSETSINSETSKTSKPSMMNEFNDYATDINNEKDDDSKNNNKLESKEIQSNDDDNDNDDNDNEPDPAFETLVLEFKDFILTAGGRPREYQRTLDGDITINHIGFLLADGNDGDFKFDIAKVRVVNISKDGTILEDTES